MIVSKHARMNEKVVCKIKSFTTEQRKKQRKT